MTAAEFMRNLREQSGDSIDTMAANLDCSLNHLYGIDIGFEGITPNDVAGIFKKYKLKDALARDLVLICAEHILFMYSQARTLLKLKDEDKKALTSGKWSCEYEPKKIISQGPATVVLWKDGTKTIVKKADGDDHDVYAAFCAALAKKIYGGNSTVKNIVDRNIVYK